MDFIYLFIQLRNLAYKNKKWYGLGKKVGLREVFMSYGDGLWSRPTHMNGNQLVG